jgi:hypothetical protein
MDLGIYTSGSHGYLFILQDEQEKRRKRFGQEAGRARMDAQGGVGKDLSCRRWKQKLAAQDPTRQIMNSSAPMKMWKKMRLVMELYAEKGGQR